MQNNKSNVFLEKSKSTKIINIKKKNLLLLGYDDLEDWLKDPNHVYIGRNMSVYVKGANNSKWKNPFSAKKYGRDKCIDMFKNYIEKDQNLMDSLKELDGKTLGCWCKPEACHGDILIELLNK